MARPIGGIGLNSFESLICAAQAASFHFGRASPWAAMSSSTMRLVSCSESTLAA
jgi:hypothetical protein